MKCRCKAKRDLCDVNNPLCPASTTRLLYDEQAAVKELYDFAWQDQGGRPSRPQPPFGWNDPMHEAYEGEDRVGWWSHQMDEWDRSGSSRLPPGENVYEDVRAILKEKTKWEDEPCT